MANRILSKSNQQLNFKDIAEIYNYRENALKLYFSEDNDTYFESFVGYKKDEVIEELKYQILEAEKDACLNLLAAIEASFRLDYAIRCEEKDKTKISRRFRELFSEYEFKISLEEIIFEEWKESGLIKASTISDLKGAFKYRHWLAHGRYWTLKAGKQKYDFYDLYNLALEVNTFPFKKSR